MTLATAQLTLPPKAMIGMVHVRALPGVPACALALDQTVELAATEAGELARAGFDAIIIENMHDRPYLLGDVGPEITASMTAAAIAVRRAVGCPLGVQVLAGANRQALAVALAGGADFIRAEGFVFSHVADEGVFATADAGRLLRYRKMIGAEHIAVIADIKKKHSSHAITSDVDLAETARAAQFFGADGVVVTGTATATPARVEDVRDASTAIQIPTWVGSGVTPENLPDLWPHADAFIVGSYIKKNGAWDQPLDGERITKLLEAARRTDSLKSPTDSPAR